LQRAGEPYIRAMSIHFAHTIEVPEPPARVFAVLDDFAQTPKWLSRCTSIEALTPGPKAPGTKLRYAYKEGGRAGIMDGEIAARAENERITMRYGDKMMDVSVDFHMVPNGGGTKLTHTIDITLRSIVGKLFTPVIRSQLPKQTVSAMESLRALLATS
jgi:carbon monoxide dehydrogenase subunit G